MPKPHWSRDDVTVPLTEELGFVPDPDAPSILFCKGDDFQLVIVDGYGTTQLMHNKPLWSITFTSSVPAEGILAAVRAVAGEA
jgi:hypothetical protein